MSASSAGNLVIGQVHAHLRDSNSYHLVVNSHLMVDSRPHTEVKGSSVVLDSMEGPASFVARASLAARANLAANRVHPVANLNSSATTAIRWVTGPANALKRLK